LYSNTHRNATTQLYRNPFYVFLHILWTCTYFEEALLHLAIDVCVVCMCLFSVCIRDATMYRYIAYHIVSRLYRNINTKLNCINISIYQYIAVLRLVFIKLLVPQIKEKVIYFPWKTTFKLHHVSNNILLYRDT